MTVNNLGPVTAYALAVKNGFEGTEAEWLASFHPGATAVTLLAAAWAESGGAYEQTVEVAGGTASSLIALQPTVAQLVALQGDGVVALVVDNDNGTFIARAVAAAPSSDMTLQATVTETVAI